MIESTVDRARFRSADKKDSFGAQSHGTSPSYVVRIHAYFKTRGQLDLVELNLLADARRRRQESKREYKRLQESKGTIRRVSATRISNNRDIHVPLQENI